MHNLILSTVPLDQLRSIILETVNTAFQSQKNSEIRQEEDPFLKIHEVCKMLQVSRVTIHNWKKQGILPFHRISRKIYFKKSEVVAALKLAKNRFADTERGAK
jgi:excisionase family DNA binding protein